MWVPVLDLSVGVVSLLLTLILFRRFKRVKLETTLVLAFVFLSCATASFLWETEDLLLSGNLQIATLAMIFECLPAYLGVLFSEFIVKIRPKTIASVASAIIGVAILSLLLFPLEYEFAEGAYVYYPSPIARLILVAVHIMAFFPVGLLLVYAKGMKKLGHAKEGDKGIILAFGFLLLTLGICAVHYLKAPVLSGIGMRLVELLLLYFGFTKK
jgi:hypothetical protein